MHTGHRLADLKLGEVGATETGAGENPGTKTCSQGVRLGKKRRARKGEIENMRTV